ncbi:hypothetical protein V6N11_022164 [Hibiscus sabdariffa]|uniref:Uncharacterized protein n=1 Tax=Hibiscus sabdariffa TaxID=183260 RepID=A0ABR2TIC9_9ROSI
MATGKGGNDEKRRWFFELFSWSSEPVYEKPRRESEREGGTEADGGNGSPKWSPEQATAAASEPWLGFCLDRSFQRVETKWRRNGDLPLSEVESGDPCMARIRRADPADLIQQSVRGPGQVSPIPRCSRPSGVTQVV